MANSADAAAQNGESALVVATAKKRAKMGFCNSPLLLPFGKATFYVPEDAVVSVPKGTNRVENATILNQIINTKSPTTWNNYLDPDRLVLIKGTEALTVHSNPYKPNKTGRGGMAETTSCTLCVFCSLLLTFVIRAHRFTLRSK